MLQVNGAQSLADVDYCPVLSCPQLLSQCEHREHRCYWLHPAYCKERCVSIPAGGELRLTNRRYLSEDDETQELTYNSQFSSSQVEHIERCHHVESWGDGSSVSFVDVFTFIEIGKFELTICGREE